ncbi:glycosyltransferase family 2 protein [Leuconostoc citreum]|uniref:glycosyltransferase family 2 protein n=1 Tax=Leuconostoc citreum TaxID=33964 RepID=UPI000C28967B|nr:glycosyltransferase family 2 protein [Leuconostoc citreum]
MNASIKKKALYIITICLSTVYLLWRIFFTIPWQTNIFALVFALLLLASEIISSSTAFILIILRIIQSSKTSKANTVSGFNKGHAIPEIDIIIVTHNEEVDLLRKTVNAATFMAYPDKRKVHIVIADDGDRSEVKKLADDYCVKYIGLSGNKDAKSGNINHALSKLKSPLFAIFDADMIPFSTFLMHTVPLFTQNFQDINDNGKSVNKLGFVQTPQSFYNADIFQYNLFSEKTVSNEQDFFSRDINVLNGSNSVALFTGSNAIFLREAVATVGWFPTGTLTEDFELGAKINIAGYASISTLEPESSGITPVDVKGVIRQRTRWARGVIQSTRHLHIFTNPKIPMFNRIILINSYLYWWSFFRRLIYITAPLLYAIFKIQVVNANFWVLMVFWAPGYFLLHFVLSKSPSKIRSEFWGEIQETFFAPYLFLPVLLETFGFKAKRFKVTEKNGTTSLKDKVYVLPHLFLWGLTLFAIIDFNYGKWGSEIIIGSVITFWLLLHFINLTFSLFIILGRQVLRGNERFAREIVGHINLIGSNKHLTIITKDISEGGFSFSFEDQKNILNIGNQINCLLYYQNKPINIAGEVVRVLNDSGVVVYAIKGNRLVGDNLNNYLQLIYDGTNTLLPAQQNNWVTPFDALYLNILMRIKIWKIKMKNFKKYRDEKRW